LTLESKNLALPLTSNCTFSLRGPFANYRKRWQKDKVQSKGILTFCILKTVVTYDIVSYYRKAITG
jgi:hypothetical protein